MVKVNTVVMSAKLDLAIKQFDPTKKGVLSGNTYENEMFMQLYIEKLYGDQLHYIKFTDIVVVFLKQIWDFNFLSRPALFDKKKNVIFDLQNDVPEEYISEYRKTNKRFTLYPIMLTDIRPGPGPPGYTMLYMLYDKKFNCIEVFDYSFSIINKILDKNHGFFTTFFIKIYSKTVRFNYVNYGWILTDYYIKNCLKNEKYSCYSSDSSSSTWFLWFIELRLKNRDLSSKEIVYKIKDILDKNPTKICEIIIGYAQFVDKLTNDYKVVIIDNKRYISLKTKVKNAKRKRIGALVAGLIVLLSSAYIFRNQIKTAFGKNLVKK